MIWLRSLAYNAVFFGSLVVWLLAMIVLLPFPRRIMQGAVRGWSRTQIAALRAIVGLDVVVRGRDQVPPGGVILAAKHQSTWDTVIFHALFEDPCYVLKRELFRIPLWGWYARRAGMIFVDRAAGAAALRRMATAATAALRAGRQLVIFPEGTRTAPGRRRAFQPGVAALYQAAVAPVVPVALNSGRFWGRRSFLKRPGTVIIEFLPPMPMGLERRAFLAELEKQIETASERLDREATSAARTGGELPVDSSVDKITPVDL